MAVGSANQLFVTRIECCLRGSIIRVDFSSGVQSVVSSDSVGTGFRLYAPSAIVIDENDQILVFDPHRGSIVQVDPTTGNREDVTSSQVGSGDSIQSAGWGGSLALGRDESLYVTPANLDKLIRVDPRTGNRSWIPTPELPHLSQVSSDLDGNLLLYGYDFARLDPTTGELEIISGYLRGTGPRPFSVQATVAMPEPSASLAWLAAVCVLAGLSRSRTERVLRRSRC